MASFTTMAHSQMLKTNFFHTKQSKTHLGRHLSSTFTQRLNLLEVKTSSNKGLKSVNPSLGVYARIAEKEKKRYPGEAKGFVEEMRFVAMKLHTREQAKEGEKELKNVEERSLNKWEPVAEGFLKFLVDTKLVYDALEGIVDKAAFAFYEELRKTGLERSAALAKDLEWFKEKGYGIPEPSAPGLSYSLYLKELSDTHPHAFLCHFYNVYYGHAAGGRMIGKKVSEKLLDGKELEYYKWEGDLSQLLQNTKDKLNKVTENWTREEKNHCLDETEKPFKYLGEILRLILS